MQHSHKRDDEKPHDKDKPVVSEEELEEAAKPDFPDVDGDGDREEPISKAQKDKKAKGGDEKKAPKAKKGEVPPQLQKYVKGKKDKDEKEEVEEGRNNPRTTNADKFVGHEDRYHADRIHEGEKEEANKEKDEEQLYRYKNGKIVPVSKEFMAGRKVRKKVMDLLGLQESIKRIARAKKVTLNGKRIK